MSWFSVFGIRTATPLWGLAANLVRRDCRVSRMVPPTSGSSTRSAAPSAAQNGCQPRVLS
ncbi:hypothetical protein [Faecalibacterium sp. OF04-11AC]|uniref:hypothetical protein n=1 Tax=Faecalibacterium sp. OF04-11AC TaxID=2293109 RepID=UPI000FE1FB89|nr:hypothetical protein [Faecalibacterium sp. OF04-11AC]